MEEAQTDPRGTTFAQTGLGSVLRAVLSAGALAVSLVLLKEHEAVQSGKGIALAFCDAAHASGCRVAALSTYSELWPGMPVAAAAAAFFALALLFWAVSAVRELFPPLRRGFAIAHAGAGVASLFFLSIMLFRLHAVCNGCLLLHSINLLLTFAVWIPLRREMKSGIAWPSFSVAALIAAVLGGLSIAGAAGLQALQPKADVASAKQFLLTPEVAPEIAPGPGRDIELGARGEWLELTVAMDLTCPYCKEHLLNLSEALLALGRRARVRLVIYPMSETCNSNLQQTLLNSCAISRIAICKQKLGEFPEFVQQTLLHQSRAPETLDAASGEPETLLACARSDETAHALEAQLEPIADRAIQAVPVTWVNGQRIDGRMRAKEWVSFLTSGL